MLGIKYRIKESFFVRIMGPSGGNKLERAGNHITNSMENNGRIYKGFGILGRCKILPMISILFIQISLKRTRKKVLAASTSPMYMYASIQSGTSMYTPYEGPSLANQNGRKLGGYLIGSWKETTPLFYAYFHEYSPHVVN